ncbi:MAG: DUF3298 domain-containing protein [Lachnospiraceae bacterium]|nr:DUF3298 domain-containing protein [Lachnospiraceae bacterium]
MKKIKQIVLAAVLSITMLAGCGEKPEPRGSIDDYVKEDPVAEETPTPTAVPTVPPSDDGGSDQHGSGTMPTQPDLRGAAASYERTRPLKFSYGFEDNSFFYQEKNATIATAHCTTLLLEEEHSPALAAAVKELNDKWLQHVYGSEFTKMKNEAVEMNSDPERTGVYSFYDNIENTLTRSDPVVTSIVSYEDSYFAGAHGSFYFYPTILDSASGEKLSIYDVLEEGQTETLPELLDERLKNKYGADHFYDEDLAGRIRKKLEDNGDLPFSLSYDSITFYFQIYELAPFAGGYQTVTLPFNVYPRLVRSRFTEAAEEYIVQIPSYGIEIPGKDDEIYAAFHLKQYRNAEIYMSLSGFEPYSETVEAYGVEYFLVHLKSADFIIADVRALENYEYIITYRLDSNGISRYKESDFLGFWRHMPGDVQNVRLYGRRHYLSSYFVYKICYLVPDGSIVCDDDFFYIDTTTTDTLVLKHDLTAHDLEGNEVRLFEGAELAFFRTDADRWIDMKTSAGDVVRLYVDDSDWPQTIDGEDIQDIFENLYFAEE